MRENRVPVRTSAVAILCTTWLTTETVPSQPEPPARVIAIVVKHAAGALIYPDGANAAESPTAFFSQLHTTQTPVASSS